MKQEEILQSYCFTPEAEKLDIVPVKSNTVLKLLQLDAS